MVAEDGRELFGSRPATFIGAITFLFPATTTAAIRYPTMSTGITISIIRKAVGSYRELERCLIVRLAFECYRPRHPNDAGLSVVDNCFGLLLAQRLDQIVFIDHGPEPRPESLG